MWSYPHRGISPIPPAYARFGRHSPLDDHVNNPAMMMSMQESPVLRFLPGLCDLELSGSYDTRAMIEQLVATSEEILPCTKWNPLDEEELRGAYRWILRALSRVSPGEADYVISHDLMQKLEERLSVDSNEAREVNGTAFFHRRSQHLFRALAEISCKTESIKLGTILLQFFRRHAALIASIDSSSALCQWCYSVLCATARERDRIGCLSRVLSVRPELPDIIRGRGRKAHAVADRLEWVAAHMERRQMKPRRHDRLALHSPYRGVGIRDDLDVDFDGSELAALGRMDIRGRSRDRLAVPDYHGTVNRRLMSEGVYGGSNLDRRPSFGARPMNYGRSLLLREDQDSRMLQLTMEQSYIDPLELYGRRTGDVMVLRESRAPLCSEVEYDI